jgi:hypothetical protein
MHANGAAGWAKLRVHRSMRLNSFAAGETKVCSYVAFVVISAIQ